MVKHYIDIIVPHGAYRRFLTLKCLKTRVCFKSQFLQALNTFWMHLETTNCCDPIRKFRQFRSVGNMKPACLSFMSFYLIVTITKKKKKRLFVKMILEGFVSAIGKLSVHSVGGWLFYFALFSACDSCLKVICYHHGSQLLDESKCLSGLL